MSHILFCHARLRVSLCLLATLVSTQGTLGAERAEDLLPETTAVYATIGEPAALFQSVWEHPLRDHLQKTDVGSTFLESPDFLKFRSVVSVVEAQLGVTWRKAIQIATSEGIHLAIDAKTEGIVLLVGANDATQRDAMLEKIIQMARDDAKSKNQDDPYETQEYRGITAHEAGDVILAPLGHWLMLTNESELAKAVADAHLDGSDATLTASENFKDARGQIHGSPVAWGYADLKLIRDRGAEPALFRDRSDNIVSEMLLGGIFADMKEASLLVGAVYGDQQQLRLELSMEHVDPPEDDPREYYFGSAGEGRAPPLLKVDRGMLSLSTYRDLSQLWLRAGDLLESRAVDELAEMDSGLTNLFAGKDFGEDILGAFDPRIQLVVRRQDFSDRTPQPAVKLPSFALVFRLKDPETMRPELRRTFQSLVGFLNVAGSSQGQPQLDQGMRTDGDMQLVLASYVPEADERDSKDARINFNFSPSIGFVGDRFVLSSTKELAVELTEMTDDEPNNDAAEVVNSYLVAKAESLSELLKDNREQLVAQNMLEKGHGEAEASKEIDGLLQLAKLLDTAALKLSVIDQRLRFVLSVDVNTHP